MADKEQDAEDQAFFQNMTQAAREERRKWKTDLKAGFREVIEQLFSEAETQRKGELDFRNDHQEWLEDLQRRVEDLEALLDG